MRGVGLPYLRYRAVTALKSRVLGKLRLSLAYEDGQFYSQAAIDCEVVDTLGAGDSFIAGFLHGLLSGLPMQERMRLGAENASITIGYLGAW